MEMTMQKTNTFLQTLKEHGIYEKRNSIELVQLNITKKCNQSCTHCHVNAGPRRSEEMSLLVIDRILDLLRLHNNVKTVDITGGAPELNTNFKYLVQKLRELNLNIIDRCNLTVLLENGQEDTAKFLAENKVTIIASLPCYTEENVDFQRGNQIFKKSILVLKQLNALGYGKEDSGLLLNLVYNPLGDYLPGDQKNLEDDYRLILKEKYDINFNHLYTITNMPINRFAAKLKQEGKYEDYFNLLYSKFNENAADKIMCKKQISIGLDGKLYDCDFNQAEKLSIYSDKKTIWDIEDLNEISNTITFKSHCFGCTAGNGSSCQGKLD